MSNPYRCSFQLLRILMKSSSYRIYLKANKFDNLTFFLRSMDLEDFSQLTDILYISDTEKYGRGKDAAPDGDREIQGKVQSREREVHRGAE